MKNICFINGSLRGKEASSLVFLNSLKCLLPDAEFKKEVINVRPSVKGIYPEDILKSISCADAIVMVFPLFTYGIPGALMRLLEDFDTCAKSCGFKNAARVYAVVNCAFPRPQIMAEMIRVAKNFCRRLSLNWRFAVCLGGGPVAAMTMKIPLLNIKYKRAFSAVASDIENGGSGHEADYFIKPFIPEPVMLWIKLRYEKKMKAGTASK